MSASDRADEAAAAAGEARQADRAIAVTVIGPLPPARGISPYVRSLVTALSTRTRISVEVLGFRSLYPKLLYPGGDPAGEASDADLLPDAIQVRNTLVWWNPAGWAVAGFTLRGDLVHAQWWSFVLAPMYLTVLSIARLRRKPVIITVHNVAPHEGGLLRRMMNRSVLPLADLIIVHSERNRAAIQRLVPRTPVRVIPHGILPLAATDEARGAVRARLGIPEEAEVVLAFGHLRPYKGIADLLRAFGGIHARHPHAHLLIAGEPWEAWEPYQDLISVLGIGAAVTVHLGFVPEPLVPDLFAAADLAVLPYTHFDGQSGAGTLAVSAGLPLVVTDVGGLPDLVDAPEAVVPPGSIPRLERAIAAVLEEPDVRARLAAGSARRAREMSWDAVTETTVRLYEEVRAKRGGRGLR